ncbi:MAG: CRTAC1 family protein [Verrucomicrobia bacterium]|nr:CRTAC1 family protein [Verrucomicrobiota bacterium]
MNELSKRSFAAWLVLLSIGVAVFAIWFSHESPSSDESANPSDRPIREITAKLAAFEAREREVAESVWGKELLAQECGRTFEGLWDSLNAATNKLKLAADFPVSEIVLGDWSRTQDLPHGIKLRNPLATGRSLTTEEWRRFVEEFARAGWRLEQTEFRHTRFDTDEAGLPRQSRFYFSAHLTRSARSERAAVEGDLIVEWAATPAPASVSGRGSLQTEDLPASHSALRAPHSALVKQIDASRLTLKTRAGEPPFRMILQETIAPPEKSATIDPLILYDLDEDGLSEIVLAAKNLVYRRRGKDRYEPEPLCRIPPGLIFTAVIADSDGDGTADFLCAKPEGLIFFKGSERGAFNAAGRLVWMANPRLQNASVLTCGDIDQDGDLDLFLGQYKIPTLGQVLRPNFHDANDGHPAYLLLNDGRGNFTDATAASGLEHKRFRRVFSASFADLNDDGRLDLVVASDFAGVDLYRNDGRGHFTDVTPEWVEDSHAFGMAHALADFNADGRLDLLMIGMNSPTVDRLEHLGLARPGAVEDTTMRSRMTFGNRLFLARAESGFVQTPLSESIARSGWSWGCSAFDFDNDGFPDVYVANGHESKQTVRDYEPEFWLHDIYVDDSVDDAAATAYFTSKFARTRGRGWSYAGYEKNRLYLNQRGELFVEIGHLWGIAMEQDSRNVVADDLDGDGRVDLLVTTLEVWPVARQTLRVFKNMLENGGNWIGFHFREEAGKTLVGARVTLHYNGREVTRQIVTGDSYRSQHANTVHFGLGTLDRVVRAEIRWPGGKMISLDEPPVNRYHSIPAPK